MEPDPRYGQSARTTQTTRRHLEQVAAALSPLRASNNRSALANAVARLVTGVAVACRIDVFEEAEGSDLPGLVTLSRTVRMDCSSLSDPTGDLGTAEARAGQAAIVPDPARGLVWVVIPLVANRATTGALRLALAKEGDPSPAEVAYLHHIANSLAIGLSSAELHEQSERVSRRLQESLLQRELPASDWFQVAGRYLPATAGMHVGGDWYDAHLITPDELAFSVGDVAGHGVEAAARMGELRSAMRAFRLLSRAPDDLIGLLHRLCDPAGDFATALCARLGPGGGFRWASAGHLPPVLAHPTGEVERLVGHQSPPLGAGIEGVEGTVALDQHRLTPGDTVVLFTDGLI
ncbi:MAG TPA: SpoIIE family protein phosphatase, partial [Acidimicrobiales bacterium]|nr:SpoIIE family protein phosphatase [Acidimicrobiales bacterium]